MATPKQLVDNQANVTADTIETLFTAPTTGNGVIIDAFTASNTSQVNASYKAYITSISGTIENPQQPFKVVVWDDIDLGAGLINQLIPPGGKLSTETSATNSIYFTVSGKEV